MSTKRWLKSCVVHEGKRIGNVNVIFCNDAFLLEMNQKHLNHDTYTDVITFDYCIENNISGDVFISVDRVHENAHTLGVDFSLELLRVIIHGVLHLCGYHDKKAEEKSLMRDKESFYLLKYS